MKRNEMKKPNLWNC